MGRKKGMTDEDLMIHDFAVRVRKKTDVQLYELFEEARREGTELDEEEKGILERIGVKHISKGGKPKTPNQLVRELAAIITRSKTQVPCGFFKNQEARARFIDRLNRTPGIGKATIGKIEQLIGD